MNIAGEIIIINEAVQVSDSFRKAEFVIKTGGKYPQTIQFQLSQDRCELINSFKVGDSVDVHFNLRGREWTNPQGEVKYFNSLDAWKIESLVEGGEDEEYKSPFGNKQEDDDLPF